MKENMETMRPAIVVALAKSKDILDAKEIAVLKAIYGDADRINVKEIAKKHGFSAPSFYNIRDRALSKLLRAGVITSEPTIAFPQTP